MIGAKANNANPEHRYTSMKRRTLIGAAVLAVALLSWLVGLKAQLLKLKDPLRPLLVASRASRYRPIEARLSGGFEYRPLRPISTGGTQAPSKDDQMWRLLAVAAQTQNNRDTSFKSQHVAAVGHLITGNFDSAISKLFLLIAKERDDADTLLIRHSNDQEVLVDLSAAYHTKAIQTGRIDDVALALEAAERAWALRRTPEAAWNRALAIEALKLKGDTIRAWETYLLLDPESPYSAEALRHLAKARESTPRVSDNRPVLSENCDHLRSISRSVLVNTVRSAPQAARECGEDELAASMRLTRATPGEWKHLDLTVVLAEERFKVGGERLLLDAATLVASDRAVGRRHQWIEAYVVYANAREAYKAGQYSQASQMFGRARDAFNDLQSPYVHLASVWMGASAFYLNRMDDCLDIANGVRSLNLENHGWIAAAAYAHWIYSLAALATGHASAAIEARSLARTLFLRIGETENAAAMDSLLAEAYEHIGESRIAWLHRQAAVVFIGQRPTSRRLYAIMDEAADAALTARFIAVALLFQKTLLESSMARGDHAAVADGFRWRGTAYTLASEPRNAVAAVDLGRKAVQDIKDSDVRRRVEADLDLVFAQAALSAQPQLAAIAARRTLSFCENTERYGQYGDAAVILAKALNRLGREREAMEVLRDAIKHVELQRREVRSASQRLTYLGINSAVYDELAAIFIRRKDYLAALDILESARGRAYLDARTENKNAATSDSPLDSQSIRSRVSPEMAVVMYSSVHSAAWVVRNDSIKFAALPHAILSATVGARNRDLRSNSRLAKVLIDPIWPYIKTARQVTFVVDRALGDIAFAGLRTPDGPLIVDAFVVSNAPSCTLAVLNQTPCGPPLDGRAIVAVQSSSANPPLKFAQHEASDVASRFRDTQRLTEVKLHEFVSAAERSDFIHIIGHGYPDPNDDFMSGISILNAGTRLKAHDVMKIRLRPCSTVVLSGCRTAVARHSRGEASTSMANAFLGAGARYVIATVSDVEDDATAAFMVLLYDEIDRGYSVPEAVRRAQVRQKQRGLSNWEAFIVMGAA